MSEFRLYYSFIGPLDGKPSERSLCGQSRGAKFTGSERSSSWPQLKCRRKDAREPHSVDNSFGQVKLAKTGAFRGAFHAD